MSTDNQKKIMSFEEFCTAQLGGVATPGATQPDAAPAPPEMQLPEPETDITMMDGPEADAGTGDTETPETDAAPSDTEAEKPVEEPATK